ncbi:hypothetical protein HanRHA438_Chr14g0643301 [Helianthus annuus]|nr:hypothetical protein HanRHA438_Chr14g0643301 [Helianthus annuus]
MLKSNPTNKLLLIYQIFIFHPISCHLQSYVHVIAYSGAAMKGPAGAPDPPNFSLSSVMYVRFV